MNRFINSNATRPIPQANSSPVGSAALKHAIALSKGRPWLNLPHAGKPQLPVRSNAVKRCHSLNMHVDIIPALKDEDSLIRKVISHLGA